MENNKFQEKLINIINLKNEEINDSNLKYLIEIDILIEEIYVKIENNKTEDLLDILNQVLVEKNKLINNINIQLKKSNNKNIEEIDIEETMMSLKDDDCLFEEGGFISSAFDIIEKEVKEEIKSIINVEAKEVTKEDIIRKEKTPKVNKEKVIENSINFFDLPIIGAILAFIFSKYKEAQKKNEQHLFFLTFISSILMIVGAYWGVDYALDKGYIPIGLRTVIGFALSIGMIYLGNRIYKKEFLHGLSLFAVGVLSFYGLYYFAIMYYQVNVNIGFIFIMLSSLMLFYHSDKENQSTMFVIVLIASTLSTLFFSNIEYLSTFFDIFNKNNYVFQNINMIIVACSFLAIILYSNVIAMKNNYDNLKYLMFILFSTIITLIISNENISGNISVLFVLISSLSFVLPVIFSGKLILKEIEELQLKSILYIFTIFAFYISTVLYIVEMKDLYIYLLLSILISLMFMFVFFAIKVKELNKLLFSFLLLMVVSIITIVGFYYFENQISIIMLIEALALMFIGYKDKINFIKIESLLLMVAVLINYEYSSIVDFNLIFISLVMIASSIIMFEFNTKTKIIMILEYLLSIVSVLILLINIVFTDNILMIPVLALSLVLFNYRKINQMLFLSIINIFAWIGMTLLIDNGFNMVNKAVLFFVIIFITQMIKIKNYSLKTKIFSELTRKYLIVAIPLFIISSIFRKLDGNYIYAALSILSLTVYCVSRFLPERFNIYKTKEFYKVISLGILSLLGVVLNELFMLPIVIICALLLLEENKFILEDKKINISFFRKSMLRIMTLITPLICFNYFELLPDSWLIASHLIAFSLISTSIILFSRLCFKYIIENNIINLLYISNVITLILSGIVYEELFMIVVVLLYTLYALKDNIYISENKTIDNFNKNILRVLSLITPLIALNYISLIPYDMINPAIFLFAFVSCVIFYLGKHFKEYSYKNHIIHLLYIPNLVILFTVFYDIYIYVLIMVYMYYISWILKDLNFKDTFFKITYFLTPFFILFELFLANTYIQVDQIPELIINFYMFGNESFGISMTDIKTYIATSMIVSIIMFFLAKKYNNKLINITQMQFLILLSFFNIYLFIFVILCILHFNKMKMLELFKNKIYIISFAISPVLLIMNGEDLLYAILSYALLISLFLSNIKEQQKVLLSSLMLCLLSIIMSMITGDGIFTGVALTFILLIPLVYSFYQLIVSNNKDYKISYYVLLSIILIKLSFIDFNITNHLKELVIVFGIVLFVITFIIKKIKNKNKENK
jgi:hypothetical protein